MADSAEDTTPPAPPPYECINDLSAFDRDPLDMLFDHYGVAKVSIDPTVPIGDTLNTRITREHGSTLPSHVLYVHNIDADVNDPPILVPMQAAHWTSVTGDALPQTAAGSPSPLPFRMASGSIFITLPVVPVAVNHVPSIPLLLVLSMGLAEVSSGVCCLMLPADVIAEFPAEDAMVEKMARFCSVTTLLAFKQFNEGLWRNALSLPLSEAHDGLGGKFKDAYNTSTKALSMKRRWEASRQD